MTPYVCTKDAPWEPSKGTPVEYTYHTLEAFARLFEAAAAAPPGKVADQTGKGKGY